METVILNNMDKLLSPIEQAELVGILKKPEELIYEQKRHYFFYGVIITCALALGGFLIYKSVEKNKQNNAS